MVFNQIFSVSGIKNDISIKIEHTLLCSFHFLYSLTTLNYIIFEK